MVCTNIDYDTHLGRIAIGRIRSGTMSKGEEIGVCTPESQCRKAKVTELFMFADLKKVPVAKAEAGDIVAMSGVGDIQIGETIMCPKEGVALPVITVEEPTVSVNLMINTTEFAGREGKFVTTRNIKERLDRELERNVALKVEAGSTGDSFKVSGRGTLHLAILFENMRREGFEFQVGPPEVIIKKDEATGVKMEPYEEVSVEVAEEYQGSVVEILSKRKGELTAMEGGVMQGTTIVKFKSPTRGLMGVRNSILTATRGTGVLHSVMIGYQEWSGEMQNRDQGSLLAFETGDTTKYALEAAESRGKLFVGPGQPVYKDQIIGANSRPDDMKVNICKVKQLTNMRASGKDTTSVLTPPIVFSLDDAMEYIQQGEMVEVTPTSIRMRKMPGEKSGKGR